MKIVIFYEKPGCATNAKQKKSLRDAGCMVIERNLLEHGLTMNELHAFLQEKPHTQWFNQSAPDIKNGVIEPALMSPAAALQTLMRDPILIKRPLMVVGGKKLCGFEQKKIEALIERPLDQKITTACSAEHTPCESIKFKL
ncbi:ArsC/Spx/MgsR family protein [Sulfurimonas sp. HSL3-7]|uniref:ArsC/Spx/MgsR family protein n=1 Tax=Sulfonitrofixus jiaomeiensis TaxID=3131938 RepID=UPI0031F76230